MYKAYGADAAIRTPWREALWLRCVLLSFAYVVPVVAQIENGQ